MSDVDLNKFASEGKDYIKLDDGGSFTGNYVNLSEGVYDKGSAKGKKFVTYHFDIGGEIKTFSSSSKLLAMRMSNVPFMSNLTIKRFGRGTDTVYEVEVNAKAQADSMVQDIANAMGGTIVSAPQEDPKWDEER